MASTVDAARKLPVCENPLTWIKDDRVKNCPSCRAEFSLLTRKHHCRSCGNIFCYACTSDKILVKGYNGPQKCCFGCYCAHYGLTQEENNEINKLEKKIDQQVKYKGLILYDDLANNQRVKGIIVITEIMIIIVQQGGKKVLKTMHILDIKKIKKTKNKLIVEFGKLSGAENNKKSPANRIQVETLKYYEIMQTIQENHDLIFSLLKDNENFKITFELGEGDDKPLSQATKLSGFDEFMLQYKAFSNFYSIKPQEEFIEYIFQLYEEKNREIKFARISTFENELNPPINIDIRAFIECLSINSFFRSFEFDNIKRKSIQAEIFKIMKRNTFFTNIKIKNIKNESSLNYLFGKSLLDNKNSSLIHFHLVGIKLNDEKSIKTLTEGLRKYNHQLKSLRLSNCSLNGKLLMYLTREGLEKNYGLTLGVEELDFSGNKLDGDNFSNEFQKFLLKIAPHSSLKTLNFSKTNVQLSFIIRCLHIFKKLEDINFSGNSFDQNGGGVPLFCTFLENCETIKKITLASCQLRPEWINDILKSLQFNAKLMNLSLNFSGNTINEKCISAFSNSISQNGFLNYLNLSSMKLGEGLLFELFKALQTIGTNNSRIESLVLNDALLSKIEEKAGMALANSLVTLLNVRKSIKVLSLSGGYSNEFLVPLIKLLNANESLLELNVSNNKLMDVGACYLGRLLHNNHFLASISFDNNKISLSGFQSIWLNLKNNNSLVRVEFPWNDFSYASSQMPDPQKVTLLRECLMKIQCIVEVNRSRNPLARFEEEIPQFNEYPQALLPVPAALLESKEGEEGEEVEEKALPPPIPYVASILPPIHNETDFDKNVGAILAQSGGGPPSIPVTPLAPVDVNLPPPYPYTARMYFPFHFLSFSLLLMSTPRIF